MRRIAFHEAGHVLMNILFIGGHHELTAEFKKAAVIKALMSECRDECLRILDEARTPHENQHLAYHEAGHALLEMLFYKDLQKVTIKTFFDVKTKYLYNGLSTGLDPEAKRVILRGPDYDGNDARVGAFLTVLEIAGNLAGPIAEKQFCTCGWNPDGDGYDRENLGKYYDEIERGRLKEISPSVSALVSSYRPQLDAIAKALFDRKTLTGAEVREVMAGSGYADDFDSDQFCLDTIEVLIPDPSVLNHREAV
jgi:hypothetical protein